MRSIDELFLYFPTKYPEGDWAPKQLKFQDVYFSAADGTKLHGWYCPCDTPQAVILIAHGNGGHIANRTPWLEYLQSIAKVSVFIFDYRGYGRSEGKPSVKGVLEDARAARIQTCKLASIADSKLVLMGESLGGAVVTQLASESPPRALILQSTFSSLKDVATVHYSKRLSWVIPKNKLNSAEAIKQYHGPLLQSHGSNDSIIPIELGKKLFDAANEPKTWYTVPGVDHNDALTPGYFEQLDRFLNSLP